MKKNDIYTLACDYADEQIFKGNTVSIKPGDGLYEKWLKAYDEKYHELRQKTMGESSQKKRSFRKKPKGNKTLFSKSNPVKET